MRASVLDSIDFFAQKAIDLKATPGCQILVAKDGKIIYDKSFGYTTYENKQAINAETIYDLASITKVAATTIASNEIVRKWSGKFRETFQNLFTRFRGQFCGQFNFKRCDGAPSGLACLDTFLHFHGGRFCLQQLV
jgi:hypothetical protein